MKMLNLSVLFWSNIIIVPIFLVHAFDICPNNIWFKFQLDSLSNGICIDTSYSKKFPNNIALCFIWSQIHNNFDIFSFPCELFTS